MAIIISVITTQANGRREEFDTITVDPTTLVAKDNDGEPVDLFGRGGGAVETLREIIEQACRYDTTTS